MRPQLDDATPPTYAPQRQPQPDACFDPFSRPRFIYPLHTTTHAHPSACILPHGCSGLDGACSCPAGSRDSSPPSHLLGRATHAPKPYLLHAHLISEQHHLPTPLPRWGPFSVLARCELPTILLSPRASLLRLGLPVCCGPLSPTLDFFLGLQTSTAGPSTQLPVLALPLFLAAAPAHPSACYTLVAHTRTGSFLLHPLGPPCCFRPSSPRQRTRRLPNSCPLNVSHPTLPDF